MKLEGLKLSSESHLAHQDTALPNGGAATHSENMVLT